METALIHSQTKISLDHAAAGKPQALMLLGPEGAGKLFLSRLLVAGMLGITDAQIDKDPYVRIYLPEKNTLSIGQIRDLQKFMQLKTPGTKTLRRVAVIADAHTMTIEAQNALLKVLEEPPADSMIILTLQGDRTLKPTVYSRAQQIIIKPVTKADTLTYYTAKGISETAISTAHALSHGSAGLLDALIRSDTQHPLVQSIKRAKELVNETAYTRLTNVDQLSKDKDNLPTLLYALKRVSHVGLAQAVDRHNHKAALRWKKIMRTTHETEKAMAHNPNTKLLLTNLMLNM